MQTNARDTDADSAGVCAWFLDISRLTVSLATLLEILSRKC